MLSEQKKNSVNSNAQPKSAKEKSSLQYQYESKSVAFQNPISGFGLNPPLRNHASSLNTKDTSKNNPDMVFNSNTSSYNNPQMMSNYYNQQQLFNLNQVSGYPMMPSYPQYDNLKMQNQYYLPIITYTNMCDNNYNTLGTTNHIQTSRTQTDRSMGSSMSSSRNSPDIS